MKVATTTGDFGLYLEKDKDRIQELYNAGFRYIDLSMYRFTPDCVHMKDGWEKEVLALKEFAQSLGMQFVQAHSQGGNPLSENSEHVIPYMGTRNHDKVINALIDVKFNGYFTLECDNSLVSAKGWPHARRSFDKDNRLFVTQLFMARKIENLMYDIAKHILSSYDLFEE